MVSFSCTQNLELMYLLPRALSEARGHLTFLWTAQGPWILFTSNPGLYQTQTFIQSVSHSVIPKCLPGCKLCSMFSRYICQWKTGSSSHPFWANNSGRQEIQHHKSVSWKIIKKNVKNIDYIWDLEEIEKYNRDYQFKYWDQVSRLDPSKIRKAPSSGLWLQLQSS